MIYIKEVETGFSNYENINPYSESFFPITYNRFLLAMSNPESMLSLSLVSTGLFQVFIKREVKQSTYITVLDFSHLSEINNGLLAPFSGLFQGSYWI